SRRCIPATTVLEGLACARRHVADRSIKLLYLLHDTLTPGPCTPTAVCIATKRAVVSHGWIGQEQVREGAKAARWGRARGSLDCCWGGCWRTMGRPKCHQRSRHFAMPCGIRSNPCSMACHNMLRLFLEIPLTIRPDGGVLLVATLRQLRLAAQRWRLLHVLYCRIIYEDCSPERFAIRIPLSDPVWVVGGA